LNQITSKIEYNQTLQRSQNGMRHLKVQTFFGLILSDIRKWTGCIFTICNALLCHLI